MRVLLVSGEFPPMQGGVGDYTALLAGHLAKQGIEVAIATRHASSLSSSIGSTATGILASTSPKITAHALNDQGSPMVFRIVRRWDFSGFRHVAGLATGWQADVVHVQYQAAAFDMHPAANLCAFSLRKWPLVVTFHDLKVPYLFPKAGPLRPAAVRLLAASARARIVTNDEDAADLAGSRIAGRSKLHVIPIGSNILPNGEVDRQALRRKLGVNDGETLLAYFGFLHPSKGVDVLLGAMAALVRRERSVRLLILGGHAGDSDARHESYKRLLHKLIAAHSLEERVLWTGFLEAEDISAHLMASDVVVLPFSEGVSLRHGTLHAAMIHRLPIVTTLPKQVPPDSRLPVLIDGVNALLVPPGNVDAVSDAVQRLIDEPALRPKLSAGVAELADFFSWPAIAAQTISVYERLLAGVGRRSSAKQDGL